MCWRRSQNEPALDHIVGLHMAQPPISSRGALPRVSDVPLILIERKSLASVYSECHSLILVLQSIGKDALGEGMGSTRLCSSH